MCRSLAGTLFARTLLWPLHAAELYLIVHTQTAADSLGKQLEQHTRASEALFGNIRALESKVAEALSKKETLKARAASAQVRFHFVKCNLSCIPPGKLVVCRPELVHQVSAWIAGKHRSLLRMRIMSWLTASQRPVSVLA